MMTQAQGLKRHAVMLACLVSFLLLTGCPFFSGSIQVTSTPPGARIYLAAIDTKQFSSATINSVPAGEHTVRLILQGYDEASAKVTVTAGQTAELSCVLKPTVAGAPYSAGSPVLTDLFVSTSGDDTASGTTSTSPLKTLSGAWAKIAATPLETTGYRINFSSGEYPCEGDCINYFSDRTGTFQHPIILQPANPTDTVTLLGGLNLSNIAYLYIFDLTLAAGAENPAWGNNVLHAENCDHLLLRGVTLRGPDPAALPDNTEIQEVIKINQSQNIYIENCDVSGTCQTGIDFFSVQHGHLLNNKIYASAQWAAYFKGGSAYLRLEGNDIYDCGLGLQAGEGSNFEVMRGPWLHYEVYDLKAVNNVFHDIRGVALSVAGGYNIVYAFNTLYKIATQAEPQYSLFQLVHGNRVCYETSENSEHNAAQLCGQARKSGGWCPRGAGMATGRECIPSRNVSIYNNIFYNPMGSQSARGHIFVQPTVAAPSGSNITSPTAADDAVVIKGNIIWNGAASHLLGLDETTGCRDDNPYCNAAQILADNRINSIEPLLVAPAAGNYKPAADSPLLEVPAAAIPDFSWTGAPAQPPVPGGNTSNAFPKNRDGAIRPSTDHPGAY